jgi:hypothetical protein
VARALAFTLAFAADFLTAFLFVFVFRTAAFRALVLPDRAPARLPDFDFPDFFAMPIALAVAMTAYAQRESAKAKLRPGV